MSIRQWTDCCPDELRAHVSECSVCSEVVEVARAFHESYSDSQLEARIPSAGLVWWRAELRARQQAVRTVERPLTVAHALGAACVAGAAAALAVRAWPWFQSALPSIDTSGFGSISLLEWGWPLAAVAVMAVIGSVALYFVLSDE